MQKSAACIDVFLLMLHQQKSCKAINDYAYGGCPGHRAAVNGYRSHEFVHTFYQNGPNCNKQNHGIEQRNQH